MGSSKPGKPDLDSIDQVVGYLNFSSGNHDARFYSALDSIFRAVNELEELEASPDSSEASKAGSSKNGPSNTNSEHRHSLDVDSIGAIPAGKVIDTLCRRIEELTSENETWRDVLQSRVTLGLISQHVLPALWQNHRDLLFHQDAANAINSFFLARVFEATLSEGQPWSETLPWVDDGNAEVALANPGEEHWPKVDRLVNRVLSRINDYIGHRPVASLESQKIEPYRREWVSPVPLFVNGAGIAAGPYSELVTSALDILNDTSPHILRAACFDPARLKELSLDPRAYDFDHPVNKRPNHHFGGWDEKRITNDGYYDRFIVHQVILDALLARVERDAVSEEAAEGLSRDELLLEASAVLAGTMLMASGITGDSPSTYDSETTLGILLPVIGGYRDDFYKDLIEKLDEEHRERLIAESNARHQPFGAVRQDLNARLAQRRAAQLVNCRLASIFARMGYPDAAEKQSLIVPVASARIMCQIDCLLSSAAQDLDRVVGTAGPDIENGRLQPTLEEGELENDHLFRAVSRIPKVFQRLKDGIDCGAIIDPWNILGFDAQYSLFPALENSVSDHRAYDLVEMVERILALCSRLWSEAAARDRQDVCQEVSRHFREITNWWRKYAPHEVLAVEAVDPEEIYGAAELVATALNLWHQGGAETGNIKFWSGHAGMFDSPKAYALVIDALMQRGDYKTSSALLIHWLSQADFVGLQHGDSSFHEMVFRWINEQKNLLTNSLVREEKNARRQESSPTQEKSSAEVRSPEEVIDATWNRIRKFYDFLEPNAESYWKIPDFNPGRMGEIERLAAEVEAAEDEEDSPGEEESADGEFEAEDSSDVFGAAYEDVTYKDSTDDGMEGAIFEHGSGPADDALEAEVERILERLEFTATVAGFWQVAANIPLPRDGIRNPDENICSRLKKRRDIVSGWVAQAVSNRDRIIRLLDAVGKYKIPQRGVDRDSMIEYDRLRLYKDALLERAINTCVETENAVRMLTAVVRAIDHVVDDRPLDQADDDATGKSLVGGHNELVTVLAADLLDRGKDVSANLPALIEFLQKQPLLYVPSSKGGDPAAVVRARVIQTAMLELLGSLPSLGLFVETFELTRTALTMERSNPVTSGAVTEFDQLFQVAFSSMVQTLVESTVDLAEQLVDQAEEARLKSKDNSDPEQSVVIEAEQIAGHCETVLFECIEMLTESMLILWLDHSRTLRLSVMEKVIDIRPWGRLVEFIEKYGADLFTQEFFQLANVRAILHQGVASWLEQLMQSHKRPDWRLLDEIGTAMPLDKAARYISLVLEAILENYGEYCDYNTTTTQSDHGNQVFVLLDFLRLRARYERVSWNLKPVVWAHEILVRDGENGVARLWRRSLRERVGPEADKYLAQLEQLRSRYSIRMETIGRRLEEKFGHPMQIDRLRALVGPAMLDPAEESSRRSFELLYQETKAFTRATMGVGMDLPGWLAALEAEVQQNLMFSGLHARLVESDDHAYEPVPIAEIRKQLEQLPRREQ